MREAARAAAPDFVKLAGSKPAEGMTVGCYIRSLEMEDKHTVDEMIALVKKGCPVSAWAPEDISWNKMRLKQQGRAVPAAIRRPKEAAA